MRGGYPAPRLALHFIALASRLSCTSQVQRVGRDTVPHRMELILWQAEVGKVNEHTAVS